MTTVSITAIQSAILSTLLSVLTACSIEQSAQQVSLRSLHQSTYCNSDAAGVRWLSPEHLAKLLANPAGRQHLGAVPVSAPSIADDEKLILVSLGQKNSGGFEVSLASTKAEIQDGVVELPLDIRQPAPGTMQTMQLTSPCVVIGLRGTGYQRINAASLGSISTTE